MKAKNNFSFFWIGFFILWSFNTQALTLIGSGTPESFSDLVKKVEPAVVNINTAKIARGGPSPFQGVDPFFDQFLKDYFDRHYPNSNPQQKENYSLGTGFLISEDGKILTNYHVIAGADEVSVTLNNGQKLKAKVLGFDEKLDLAVVKIIGDGNFPSTTLGDSSKAEIGDWVLAVGNPFGLGQTVTAGIISAKGRVLGAGPYDDFIQTDASINPGNSGGPLFNLEGEVIGINTAIISSGQGIGFAIPINMAKKVLGQLISSGHVRRGWLGVSIKDLNDTEAQQLGISANTGGALVIDVVNQGPAAQAGLESGDVITEVNDEKVGSQNALPRLIATYAPGTGVKLTYLRQGKTHETEVILGDLNNQNKAYAFPLAPQQESSKGKIGIDVRDIEKSDDVPPGTGVYVTKVHPGSVAEAIGIGRNDIIVSVNNEAVKSVQDFSNKVSKADTNQVISLRVKRGQAIMYFAFKL